MKSTVERYLDRHSAGDIDGICELFSHDAVAYDPVDSPPHQGRDGIRSFFAGTHDMVDSIQLNLTGPIRVVSNFAAFPMEAVSHIGDLHLAVDIIDVMTFDDDGRICEMKAYWNMADARTLEG